MSKSCPRQDVPEATFCPDGPLFGQTARAHSALLCRLAIEMLGLGHSIRFRAKGNSMRPTIEDGETIIVQPTSCSDLAVGDVILCQNNGSFTAHRLLRIEHGQDRTLSFIMRGDALGTCDEPVHSQRVLGKVVGVERNGRTKPVTGLSVAIRYRGQRWASLLKRHLGSALDGLLPKSLWS